MLNFLISLILILPWVCLPLQGIEEQFRYPKAAIFDISAIILIALALKNGLKFSYQNKYLSFLGIYTAITILFNWYSPIMFAQNGKYQYNLWTIEPTLHFILGFFLVFVLCSTLERIDFIRIAKAICISATAVAIVGIMQWIHLNPFPKNLFFTAGVHVASFMDNPNLVGNYLTLSMPFFLYLNKPKYWVMGVLTFLCIIFCQSDMSLLGAIGGMSLYTLISYRSKRLFYIFVLLALIGIFILNLNIENVNFYSRFAGRIEVWEQGVKYFKVNPLFGSGLGIWKTFGVVARDVYWIEAHNDWWERTIELGLIGIFLFLLIILNSIRNFNFSKDNKLGIAYFCTFSTFLFLMSGSFVMEIAPIFLIGLLGFLGTEKIKEM